MSAAAVIARPLHWAAIARVPSLTATLGTAAGTTVALAPSLLPRPALVQGLETGLLAAVGLGLAVGIRALVRGISGRTASGRPNRPTRPATREAGLAVAVVVVAAVIAVAASWQNGLRAAMSMPAVGSGHWIEVLAVAAVSFGVAVGIGSALRRAVAIIGRIRCAAALLTLVLLGGTFGAPAVWRWADAHYARADTVLEPTSHPPQIATRTGGPGTLAPWSTLGVEGRRFVSDVRHPDAVRVYVGMDSAPTHTRRADLAVAELRRTGALDRKALVVAVPTGSGWIDDAAARAFERRFAGDVAIVGVQYSAVPSWVGYLFDRRGAVDSARDTVAAVRAAVDALPPDRRPALYVYGQSLGSVAGSAAIAQVPVCGALWAGPPAGGATPTDGTAPANIAVLANSSDPVVRFSPRLLWSPPHEHGTRTDAPVPQWLPLISFVQTGVDLLTATATPPGHGHVYGAGQGDALPACHPGRSGSDQMAAVASSPRAASYAAPTR